MARPAITKYTTFVFMGKAGLGSTGTGFVVDGTVACAVSVATKIAIVNR